MAGRLPWSQVVDLMPVLTCEEYMDEHENSASNWENMFDSARVSIWPTQVGRLVVTSMRSMSIQVKLLRGGYEGRADAGGFSSLLMHLCKGGVVS